MAIKLLYTLTASARRAYPFIVSGARKGLSTRAIERTIRSKGIPITRVSTLNPIVERLREIEIHGANIRFTNLDKTIDTIKLPESITDIRKKYSYTYRVQGTNRIGVKSDRMVIVATDNPGLTRRELDSLAEELVSEESASDRWHDVTVQLEFGLRRDATL